MYEEVLIADRLHLVGDPDKDIEKVEMFSLKPGDKVTQLGKYTKNGKESSSSRVVKFTTYATYVGVWVDECQKYIAFKFHPDELIGAKEPIDVYTLFKVLNSGEHTELMQYTETGRQLLIYQIHFELFKN